MDLGLTGKIAIVAGVSEAGALSTRLAREGRLVTINGRDQATLSNTADGESSPKLALGLQVVADMAITDDSPA